MEEQRTNLPKKNSLRSELEYYVTAWNIYLRDVVSSMDIITLLRNSHPIYRDSFARQCAETGLITKDAAKEFILLK